VLLLLCLWRELTLLFFYLKNASLCFRLTVSNVPSSFLTLFLPFHPSCFVKDQFNVNRPPHSSIFFINVRVSMYVCVGRRKAAATAAAACPQAHSALTGLGDLGRPPPLACSPAISAATAGRLTTCKAPRRLRGPSPPGWPCSGSA